MIKTAQLAWDDELHLILESNGFCYEKAQVVFVFADRPQLDNQLLEETKKKFPNATLVFGTTSGHFSNKEVLFDKPVITGVEFEKTNLIILELNTSCLSDKTNTSHKDVENLLATKDLKSVLVLSDGSTTNGSELTACLTSCNHKKIPIFGGLTADMERFEKTLTGINVLTENPKVVLIGFVGNDIHFNFGVEGGWHVFGPERTITSSDKNILFELSNINALDLYKEYLGEYSKMLPASSLYFPLSVKSPNEDRYFVRTVLNIDEKNKSMTFAGNVPQGSTVRFMKSNKDLLLDAAQDAIKKTAFKEAVPQLIFLISCVGRKVVLSNRHDEELELVLQHYSYSEVKPTLTGFYSYGEIAPDGIFSACNLYNQTITIMSIYEQ